MCTSLKACRKHHNTHKERFQWPETHLSLCTAGMVLLLSQASQFKRFWLGSFTKHPWHLFWCAAWTLEAAFSHDRRICSTSCFASHKYFLNIKRSSHRNPQKGGFEPSLKVRWDFRKVWNSYRARIQCKAWSSYFFVMQGKGCWSDQAPCGILWNWTCYNWC